MQDVIDQAVRMATRAAMNGKPVKRIVWVPPTSPTESAVGSFAVEIYKFGSASDRAPWDYLILLNKLRGKGNDR